MHAIFLICEFLGDLPIEEWVMEKVIEEIEAQVKIFPFCFQTVFICSFHKCHHLILAIKTYIWKLFQCHTNMQTIIKNVEGLGIEYDENIMCDVCRSVSY